MLLNAEPVLAHVTESKDSQDTKSLPPPLLAETIWCDGEPLIASRRAVNKSILRPDHPAGNFKRMSSLRALLVGMLLFTLD
jgi:hypothetical protein